MVCEICRRATGRGGSLSRFLVVPGWFDFSGVWQERTGLNSSLALFDEIMTKQSCTVSIENVCNLRLTDLSSVNNL